MADSQELKLNSPVLAIPPTYGQESISTGHWPTTTIINNSSTLSPLRAINKQPAPCQTSTTNGLSQASSINQRWTTIVIYQPINNLYKPILNNKSFDQPRFAWWQLTTSTNKLSTTKKVNHNNLITFAPITIYNHSYPWPTASMLSRWVISHS